MLMKGQAKMQVGSTTECTYEMKKSCRSLEYARASGYNLFNQRHSSENK